MNVQHLELDQARAVRWEFDSPDYRVDFWRQLPPPPGGDPAKMGFERDSYYLTGADRVQEVLDWAEENRGEKTFVVYAMASRGGEDGVIRLYGDDPTTSNRHTES
jgi:hypothetical protein